MNPLTMVIKKCFWLLLFVKTFCRNEVTLGGMLVKFRPFLPLLEESLYREIGDC